jgi:glucose dehydrogenase
MAMTLHCTVSVGAAAGNANDFAIVLIISRETKMEMNKALCLALLINYALPATAQDWPFYGGDAGGTRYSPLKQITRSNVNQLKPAWTYHATDISDGTEFPVKSAFDPHHC